MLKLYYKIGYELTVLTAKTTVSEVLDENNIVLDENSKKQYQNLVKK